MKTVLPHLRLSSFLLPVGGYFYFGSRCPRLRQTIVVSNQYVWVEPYAHTARYTNMKFWLLMLILVGLVLTYILYRRWKENERRKQEEAERKKEVEEYKKYCARFGDPFTAN